MATSRNRSNFPHSLGLEPLEDRLLLSHSFAVPVLLNDIAALRSAGSAAVARAPGNQDGQIGQVHALVLGPDDGLRQFNPSDGDHYEGHEELALERREHIVLEWAKFARAEAVAVNLLMEHETSLPAISIATGPPTTKAETGDSPPTPSAPPGNVSDAAWFAPHDGTSFLAATGIKLPFNSALNEVKDIADCEDLSRERIAADSLVSREPAQSVRFPAGIIPLLDKLSFDVPDLRPCLDELWVHLSALHDPRHSTWASVSCAVWLVALAGIALEAARHWKANASGNRAFLAAPAWMPENYLPEETS